MSLFGEQCRGCGQAEAFCACPPATPAEVEASGIAGLIRSRQCWEPDRGEPLVQHLGDFLGLVGGEPHCTECNTAGGVN